MKTILKKSLLCASIFTMLFAGMPKQDAKAGLILAPTGVGILVLIYGAIYNHLGLIILDDEGATSKLANDFRARYGHLSSSQQAFEGLAKMVVGKIPAEGLDREIEVNFSRKEIVRALGPSAANRQLVNAVSLDLM
jgi:hypothetical protein